MRPLDPRLLRYARAAAGYLAVCTALGVVVAVCVVAQARLLADALAGAVEGHLGARELRTLLLGLAVVVGVRALLAWAQEGAATYASARVKSTLRRQVLDRSLALGPAWSAGERGAALTTLVTTGLDGLDGYFAKYLPQLVLAVTVPGLVAAQVWAADPLSAAILLVTLPLVPVFMVLVGLTTRDRTRRRWRALTVLASQFSDVLAGLPTLKLFGRAGAQAAALRRVGEAHRRETLATLRLAFLSALVLELLATLAVALVAVGVGVRVVSGDLGLEVAFLVLILAPEAYLPLRQVGAHFHASADGLAAAEEALRVLETPPSTGGSTPPPGPYVGAVGLEAVAVRHPGRTRDAVTDVTLTVSTGEVVALAGASGSGKSSLVDVVLGFVRPTRGRVVLSGPRRSGSSAVELADVELTRVDLPDVDLAAWRRQVAWVPQRPHLLPGTVDANVRLGVPAATAPQVRDALARAGATGVSPSRLVGEDGAGLSAGEQRRVALARALLRTTAGEARFLLLDEPSAGLDHGTERAVVAAVVDARRRGCGVLLVAHRPALAAVADRVVSLRSPGDPPCRRDGHEASAAGHGHLALLGGVR